MVANRLHIAVYKPCLSKHLSDNLYTTKTQIQLSFYLKLSVCLVGLSAATDETV